MQMLGTSIKFTSAKKSRQDYVLTMPKPQDVKAIKPEMIKTLEEWMQSFDQVLEKVKTRAAIEASKMESQTAYTDVASQRKKAANILGRLNDPSGGGGFMAGLDRSAKGHNADSEGGGLLKRR